MRSFPRYRPTDRDARPKACTFVLNGQQPVAMILPHDFTPADELALRAAVERTNYLKTNGGRGMRS